MPPDQPAVPVSPPAAAPPAAAATVAKLVPNGDLMTTLRASPNFTTFVKALDDTNLASLLKSSPGLTVFAPTDAAFDSYLKAAKLTKAELLASPDLKYVLKQHVVKATTGLASSKWTQGQALKSWLSETAPIVVSKDGASVLSPSFHLAGQTSPGCEATYCAAFTLPA